MEDLFGFILFEIILSGIGWVCLYVWYRDRKKVEKIKNEKYGGKYGVAGMVMTLNLIAGAGAIAMIGVVILFLVASIYKAITD